MSISITLEPYAISGQIQAVDGNTVADAPVEVTNSSGSIVANGSTDADGNYSIEVPSTGDYTVTARSGDLSESKTVTVNESNPTANLRFGRDLGFRVRDKTANDIYLDGTEVYLKRPSGGIATSSTNHNDVAYFRVADGRTYNLTVVSDAPAVYEFTGYTVQETLTEAYLTIPAFEESATTSNDSDVEARLAELEDEIDGLAVQLNSEEPMSEVNYTIRDENGTAVYNGSEEFDEPTEYYQGHLSDNVTDNGSQLDNATLEYAGEWDNGTTFNGTAGLSGTVGGGSGGVFGPTGSGGGSGGSPIVGVGLLAAGGYAAYRLVGGGRSVGQTVSNLAGRIR